MMERFLGVALAPGEAVGLLSGHVGRTGAAERGGRLAGRARRRRAASAAAFARRFAFTVREFFPGDAVPREIGLAGPGTSGRVKVLKLGFDPPPRPEIFDVAFLRAYAPKTWEGILELLDR